MDLTYSDEQRMLADSARAYLRRDWNTDTVRELEREPDGFRRPAWNRMAELGWPAVIVDESDGGTGGALSDLVVLAEELGRAAASTPLLASVALGALPMSWSAAGTARTRYLDGLVSGATVAAGALLGPDGRRRWPAAEASRAGDGS